MEIGKQGTAWMYPNKVSPSGWPTQENSHLYTTKPYTSEILKFLDK